MGIIFCQERTCAARAVVLLIEVQYRILTASVPNHTTNGILSVLVLCLSSPSPARPGTDPLSLTQYMGYAFRGLKQRYQRLILLLILPHLAPLLTPSAVIPDSWYFNFFFI